ncbi:unnamed protein product [Heligmosomoides polygyrus]|uniref:Uncharacterized protein n=1 Tax=Heligmosomoides polygyrus TaxID=6339 RepID=A0A183GDB7_HELPZ|nr:unnamed protein product [Heligmosomoides polygyrus]
MCLGIQVCRIRCSLRMGNQPFTRRSHRKRRRFFKSLLESSLTTTVTMSTRT